MSSHVQSKSTPISATGLGHSEIRIGQQCVSPSTDVLFALLLVLVTNHPRPCLTSELLDLLWPDTEDENRRHALRQLIYRLRRLGCPITVSANRHGIDATHVTVDFHLVSDPEWPSRATLVETKQALAVYPEYVPTFSQPFAEWLDALRAGIRSRARDACLVQLHLARTGSRWSDVEAWSTTCLEADPLNEEATLARAEALAMRGSKKEAQELLSDYLRDLGDHAKTLGLPARVLRKRISELPDRQPGEVSTLPGRDREFASLVEAANTTRRGSSCTVLIHGAAGCGKTSLALHFQRFARTQGFVTICLRGPRNGPCIPLEALRDLVTQGLELPGALACSPSELTELKSFSSSGTAIGPESESASLQSASFHESRALGALVREISVEQPLLVMIDDYLDIDKPSLAGLASLLLATRGCRVLTIVTARRRPSPAPLMGLADSTHDVQLRELSRDATRDALMSRQGAQYPSCDDEADSLYALSGGHPLILRELLDSRKAPRIGSELPPSLESSLWAQVRDLSEPAQRLLSLLVLIHPEHADPSALTLEDLAESEPESLALELLNAGLLSSTDAAPPKPFVAVSLAVKKGLPLAYSTFLHFRLGTLLERKAALADSPAIAREGAHHLSLARERERAARLLRESALHQLTQGNPATAASLLEGAAKSALNDRTLLQCNFDEMRARKLSGDWSAVAVLGTGMSTHRSRHYLTRSELTEVHLSQLEAELHHGEAPQATMSRFASVMRHEGFSISARERAAHLMAVLASNLADRDCLHLARQWVASLRTAPGSLDSTVVQIIFEHDLGDLECARMLTTELVARVRVDGTAEELVRALLVASSTERSLGNDATTVAQLSEAFSISDENQLWSLAARCADSLSGVHFDAGRLAESRRWQSRADATCMSLSSHWTSRTVVHQRLRLAAHSADGSSISPQFLQEYTQVAVSDRLTVRRLHDLSALAMLAARAGDLKQLATFARDLRIGLESCRGQRRFDYIIAAYLIAMRLLGELPPEEHVADSFSASYRNSPFPPHWYLRAAITGDLGALFPS